MYLVSHFISFNQFEDGDIHKKWGNFLIRLLHPAFKYSFLMIENVE